MKTLFKTIALAAIATLAVTGCVKHEPYIHRPDVDPYEGGGQGGHGGGGGGTETVEPGKKARDDWSFSYVGREDYQDPQTKGWSEVERFHFEYKGTGRFIFRIIRQKDLTDNYNGNKVAFFQDEFNNLGENGETFGTETEDVLFDRMMSGSWIGFMFEAKKDSKGNVESFDYCEKTFTIQEEPASAAFEAWLGDWRVMSGTVGYDIKIEPIDNNFLYKITGWECGDAVSFQMDQEYLEGEFWKYDGCLYIRSQYLGSYNDTDFGYGDVDEVFLGNIFDSGGRMVIEDEGIDVAQMVMLDNDAGELRGAPVKLVTNDGDYETTFYSMQYFMWAHKDQVYYSYNANAGGFKFPFTMTRLPGTRAEDVAPVADRAATKESIHRYQPKVARGGRNTVAKKAVRMK